MLTADEGPEDERELLAERRARLLEMVGRCKPQIEQARGSSFAGLFALDPEQLYRLVLAAEALLDG